MSSFTPTFNSVLLADGSQTPVQSIGTVAPPLHFFYRLFIIYLVFL